jgi:hypothetical protein
MRSRTKLSFDTQQLIETEESQAKNQAEFLYPEIG